MNTNSIDSSKEPTVNITLYTKPVCAMHCHKSARSTSQEIDYRLIDITEVPEARENVMVLGYLQAPVVVVGNEHWCGFRPDRINALASSAA